MKAVLPLLALLLLVSSSQAAGWHNRRLLAQASYPNLLSAAQSEVQVIQQLYNGVFREQGWANTADFKPLLKVALNPQANMTAFFPSDDSWQRVADYYCLTQQGVLDNISNLREMLANYIKAHLIPNMTLNSSEFRDGMVLQSLAKPTTDPNGPFLTHTMSKVIINGSVVWKFKNASIYKIKGTHDYEDITVNPKRMDIRAGNGVIHVIDTLFRNTETERFWEGLRQQVLDRAGLPVNSAECPANMTSQRQDAFAPSQIAGLVVGVVIGLLLLAGVLMLIFVVRAHDGGFLRLGSLKAMSLRHRPTDGGSSPSGGADSPVSGSGDRFTSPLLNGNGARLLVQQASAGGSSVLTTSSWATRGSTSSCAGSVGVGANDATEQMSVVNEESPFAATISRAQHLQHAGSGAAGLVARQSSSTAADTPSSSTTGCRRATDSFGSGTPFVSKGSAGGSKKDLLALAAAGAAAHHGNNGDQQQADEQLFASLGGALVPSESVPVGRINQEHVIPISELTLKELIGSGAEGKVYRGTWKHTDIAAKEYLPIEPAQVSSANKGQSPSDAAMAHARAALAKEVHWLTSLNHPNLVRFCAVCLERPLVVMEFYKHGSVFAMLQKAARELARSRQARRKGYVAHFSWDRRLEMLHDVAAGMSYLHGKDHVHGDLRSPNLFVGADGKVKIGDFGFTKRLACNTASLKVKRITHPRWVAPELMMDNTMSRASDVYSFGIIMYELLTFKIPFDLLGKEQVVINVVQGIRPDVPQEDDLPPGTSSSTCLFTYERLMKECWAHDPAERPSFEVIARRLKAMQRWRTIISKHSTLHRAASALRQSSSCSSLAKAGAAAAAAAAAGHSGSPQAAAAAVPTANGNSAELQRARSSVFSPQTDSEQAPLRPARGSPSASQQELSCVPSYLSDYDDNELPEFDDLEDFDAALQQAASAPVSEAVVHGTRLAVIGVSSHQDEQDALASVAGAELSHARKVVLVGSDLPAGTFSRQSMRGGMGSLEDQSRAKRIGSAGPSFAGALLGDQAPRFHSVTIPARAYTQQQHGPAAATVAAAAAVLASAAAAAGRAQLPPNGKSHAAAAAAAAAAPLAHTPEGSEAGAADVQVRRHSDPTPVKGRMSDDATQDEGGCPESATAMSSGQSPFAFVHVGPPGLAVSAELQQLQAHGPDQHETLRLLESYPLSNTSSCVPSPLPSLPLTPEQAASWVQVGPPQHSSKHSQQKLLLLQLQSQHQLQQQKQHLPSGLQQQAQAAIQQQQQQRRLHQESQADMLQQQQEQVPLSQLQQLGTQDLKAGINAHVQNSSGAAHVSQQQEQVQEDLGEVYTPFDSPFYQDFTWAPCASISGLDSTHASFSAQNSSSVGVAPSVQASDSGGVSSPFIQQLRSAVMGAPAAEAVQASAASASVLPAEGSFSQFDAPVARLVSEPVLRQALTIEYRAGLTPMAAAAMEAVSVHGSSRRSSGPPSLPVSRLSSAHIPAAAAAVGGGGSGSPEQAAAGEPAAAGLGLQLDVAAAADVGPVAGTSEGAAAASVVLAESSAKSPGKTPPGAGSVAQTDQQPPLRMWRSHMDVPQGVRCSTAGDSESEPVQRPPWMWLLGLRRSLAGGSLSTG